MHLKIYGRPGCPYCTRAHQIAQELTGKLDGFSFEYIDMYEQGISKEALSELIQQPVATVPQILLDDQYIGGCTDLQAYVAEKNW